MIAGCKRKFNAILDNPGARRPTALHHLLLLPDQMQRRLADERAAAVFDRAAQADVMRAGALRRVMWRGDHVGQIEKSMVHAELAMAHRLDPPGVDAGGEVRVRDEVVVERLFLDELAAREVDE